MTDVDMLGGIRHDVRLIAVQARWAHVHGYWARGRGLDPERGADLSKPQHVRDAGPTFDVQVGSHRARAAYRDAAEALHAADVTLAALLLDRGQRTQPAVTPLAATDPPVVLDRVARAVLWRVDRLDDLARTSLTRRTTPALHRVRARVDRAVRALSAALDQGPPSGIAHGEKPCRTCKIRPQAERRRADGTRRPAKARECDTCATWRQRNRGQPRPTKLDDDVTAAPRAAQARRMARGDGWGAA